MKAILTACIALAGLPVATTTMPAQVTRESAPASVTTFYDALNAAPGKDVSRLLMQATAPSWVSCGTNDVCLPREQVIAAIAGRHKAIPDLRWEIKQVLKSGTRLRVEAPNVSIEWTGLRNPMLLDLADGRIDVVIGPTPLRPTQDIIVDGIGALGWQCFARKGHPAFREWGPEAWSRWPHLLVRAGTQLKNPSASRPRKPASNERSPDVCRISLRSHPF